MNQTDDRGALDDAIHQQLLFFTRLHNVARIFFIATHSHLYAKCVALRTHDFRDFTQYCGR